MVDELLVELEFVGASLRGKDVEDGVGGAGCGLSLCVKDGVFMEGLLCVDGCEYVVIGVVEEGELSLAFVHFKLQ